MHGDTHSKGWVTRSHLAVHHCTLGSSASPPCILLAETFRSDEGTVCPQSFRLRLLTRGHGRDCHKTPPCQLPQTISPRSIDRRSRAGQCDTTAWGEIHGTALRRSVHRCVPADRVSPPGRAYRPPWACRGDGNVHHLLAGRSCGRAWVGTDLL